MNETLIGELVRIDRDQQQELVRAARTQRYRLVRATLKRVRAELLMAYSTRAAAELIDDAVNGRRGRNALLKSKIVVLLRHELGHRNDVPSGDRIRQIIG